MTETTSPPGLWLSTESLLSNHGFNDGDMPDDVWDALDAASIPHDEIDWHHVLRGYVRTMLLPASPHRVEVEDVSTSHNPIRATKVDGRSVDAFLGPDQLGPAMRHVGVLVPMGQLVEDLRQATTGLHLAAAELLDRYGFDDGRCPEGFYDWLEARGLPDPTRAEWCAVLRRAVRAALLPLSRFAHIEIRDVDAIVHTPLQLDRVDGRPVRWNGNRATPDHLAFFHSDIAVTVPWSDLGDLLARIRAGDETGEGWTWR
ncbi:hypothetical protein [Nocardioides alkalitolerans]|uniref:hypothetical protein n=1 Tax=Nocardioides alkalitolerans TaxID=281714 RepID=UPI000417047B|nr:hypothetical protein [Nocardioides alkalitolerans]